MEDILQLTRDYVESYGSLQAVIEKYCDRKGVAKPVGLVHDWDAGEHTVDASATWLGRHFQGYTYNSAGSGRTAATTSLYERMHVHLLETLLAQIPNDQTAQIPSNQTAQQ